MELHFWRGEDAAWITQNDPSRKELILNHWKTKHFGSWKPLGYDMERKRWDLGFLECMPRQLT